MAHKIQTHDEQWGIEQAWHGLTKVFPRLTLKENFLTQWDVSPVGVYGPDGNPIEYQDEDFQEQFQVLRANDGQYIGRPFLASTYTPITNKMFLEVIEKSLAGTGHTIASLGSVCNRGRIFLSVKLEKLERFQVGKREFEAFLNFGSSHDMSSAFWANTSNICTVCNNTFTANLHHKGKAVSAKVKHTKNAITELANIAQIIDATIGVQAEFAAALAQLEAEKCNDTRANRIFTGLLVSDEDIRQFEESDKKDKVIVSTRKANQISRLGELFADESKGNDGNDLSDVFSAVTDYYSHESAGDDRMKQFISSEFGSGLRKKQEAWTVIRSPEKLDATEARGEKVLAMV